MNALIHFLRKMRRKLWRERRRAVFGGAVMFLSQIMLAYAVNPSLLMTIVPYLNGMVAVLVVMVLALLAALLLPALRNGVEVLAILSLLSAVVAFHDPTLRLVGLSAMRDQPWQLPAALAVFVLADLVYSGRVFTFPAIRGPKARYAGTSRLPQTVLWDGLVGAPPYKDKLADRDKTIAFEELHPGQPHRRVVVRDTEISTLEQHQMVRLLDPPNRIRFDWTILTTDPFSGFDSGTYDLRIMDQGRHRRVEVIDQVRSYPANLVFRAWIDDSMGRTLDERLETLERRADGPEPGALSAAPAGG